MTPEAQNIAIAKSLGYKPEQNESGHWDLTHPKVSFDRKGWFRREDAFRDAPNYHGSLDACAEFEATLADTDDDFGSRWQYIQELIEITGAECMEAHRNVFTVVNATAPQRCEAYLRTMNLWKETK